MSDDREIAGRRHFDADKISCLMLSYCIAEQEENFFQTGNDFVYTSLLQYTFFALMHLKLFAYLFFKGNFIKCYSSLAIPQGNQRNESKKGEKIDRKINFS